jgi:hypothetical protein
MLIPEFYPAVGDPDAVSETWEVHGCGALFGYELEIPM